jgi:hypothetical protein
MPRSLIQLAFRLLVILIGGTYYSYGQENNLFKDDQPLEIRFRISVREIKAISNDSVYTPVVLHYKNGEAWDSLNAEMRVRGFFRRKNCYYPPLRIKFKKEDVKGTVFEGNKSLKLVMPCKQARSNSLIAREFICYKLYESVTPYTFHTRLANITFTDLSGKKSAMAEFLGFLIEDDDLVAKRFNGKVVENMNIHPRLLHDSSAVRHDMFQYLIANTDWSTTFYHNAKVIQLEESKKYIPLAYDFDMSGVVDAPYSAVDPSLGIASVRQRIYRGFCRPEPIFQAIRHDFIGKEATIKEVIKRYESLLEPKEYINLLKYIDDFFGVIKSDGKFKAEIINSCRKT